MNADIFETYYFKKEFSYIVILKIHLNRYLKSVIGKVLLTKRSVNIAKNTVKLLQ